MTVQAHDPMRELDILILEDLTMRRELQPTRLATTLQLTSLLLVLLGVAVIFVHSLRYPAGSATTMYLTDPSHVAPLTIAP